MNNPEIQAAAASNGVMPPAVGQPTPQEAMKGPFTKIPPQDDVKAPVLAPAIEVPSKSVLEKTS